MKTLVMIKLLVVLSVISACTNEISEKISTAAESKKLAESKEIKDCQSNLELLLSEYNNKISENDFAGASRGLERCADILKDSALIEKVNEAMAIAFLEIVKNEKFTYIARKSALDNLKIQYPTEVPKNQEIINQLESDLASEVQKIEVQEKRQREKNEIQAQKQRKMRGVTIGMTQEEVLQSSWGKPIDINRTVFSFGVHEQWVYRGGNYLYFEDEILTAIQN